MFMTKEAFNQAQTEDEDEVVIDKTTLTSTEETPVAESQEEIEQQDQVEQDSNPESASVKDSTPPAPVNPEAASRLNKHDSARESKQTPLPFTEQIELLNNAVNEYEAASSNNNVVMEDFMKLSVATHKAAKSIQDYVNENELSDDEKKALLVISKLNSTHKGLSALKETLSSLFPKDSNKPQEKKDSEALDNPEAPSTRFKDSGEDEKSPEELNQTQKESALDKAKLDKFLAASSSTLLQLQTLTDDKLTKQALVNLQKFVQNADKITSEYGDVYKEECADLSNNVQQILTRIEQKQESKPQKKSIDEATLSSHQTSNEEVLTGDQNSIADSDQTSFSIDPDEQVDTIAKVNPKYSRFNNKAIENAHQQVVKKTDFLSRNSVPVHALANRERTSMIKKSLSLDLHRGLELTEQYCEHHTVRHGKIRDYGNMFDITGSNHKKNAKLALELAKNCGWNTIAMCGNKLFMQELEKRADKYGIEVIPIDSRITLSEVVAAQESTQEQNQPQPAPTSIETKSEPRGMSDILASQRMQIK